MVKQGFCHVIPGSIKTRPVKVDAKTVSPEVIRTVLERDRAFCVLRDMLSRVAAAPFVPRAAPESMLVEGEIPSATVVRAVPASRRLVRLAAIRASLEDIQCPQLLGLSLAPIVMLVIIQERVQAHAQSAVLVYSTLFPEAPRVNRAYQEASLLVLQCLALLVVRASTNLILSVPSAWYVPQEPMCLATGRHSATLARLVKLPPTLGYLNV
jgi:hypothetical protein